jgi:hypothetical protein
MDSRLVDPDHPSAARRRTAINTDSPERSQDPPQSERKEVILALEDLHEMGILEDDEFAAEMKCVSNPETVPDPVSPKPRHQRWAPTWVLTGRFSGLVSWWIVPAWTTGMGRRLLRWKGAGAS